MPGGSQNRQMTLNQDLDRSHMPVTELETSTVPQKQVSQTPPLACPDERRSVDSRLNPLESPEGLQPHVSRSCGLLCALFVCRREPRRRGRSFTSPTCSRLWSSACIFLRSEAVPTTPKSDLDLFSPNPTGRPRGATQALCPSRFCAFRRTNSCRPRRACEGSGPADSQRTS